jgi:hypothetical protein
VTRNQGEDQIEAYFVSFLRDADHPLECCRFAWNPDAVQREDSSTWLIRWASLA